MINRCLQRIKILSEFNESITQQIVNFNALYLALKLLIYFEIFMTF